MKRRSSPRVQTPGIFRPALTSLRLDAVTRAGQVWSGYERPHDKSSQIAPCGQISHATELELGRLMSYLSVSQKQSKTLPFPVPFVIAPSGQDRQSEIVVAPHRSLYVFSGHSRHRSALSLALYVPAGQSIHTRHGSCGHWYPAAQNWHSCNSALSLYTLYPIGQLRSHQIPFSATQVEFRVTKDSTCPSLHTMPGGHFWQASVEGFITYSSESQGLHCWAS
mmetsp:Transcript_38156/g.89948  ORF Transcript_38156/g.89948 Transcript_38156/m.89948 type:complete len:222 (-) Transcript_38156:232-897(-)